MSKNAKLLVLVRSYPSRTYQGTIVNRYVVLPRLAKALRFTEDGIRNWAREHNLQQPPPDALPTRSTRHYLASDVNARLAKAAYNFAAPPTISDLTTGRIVLLTSAETQEALQIGHDALAYQVRVGRLRAIKLLRDWRFDQASVEQFLKVRSGVIALTRQKTMHVLGVAEHKVYRLIHEGALDITADPTNDRRQLVTRPSLVAYLRTVLPAREDPQAWIDDRLLTELPLLAVPKAAPLVGGFKAVRGMLANGTLRYVRAWPGGEMQVEPGSIQAWLERLTPLSTEQIGHIYGVSRQMADLWLREEQLTCPVHQHDDQRLYRPCMLAVLGQFLEAKAVVQWYEKRMASTRPMLDEYQLAVAIGETRNAVRAKADKGEIRGIQRPTGVWVFNASVRKKLMQRAKDSQAG